MLILLAILLVSCGPVTPIAAPSSSFASTVTLTASATATATTTAGSCMPCGRAAATMTARNPATQTAQFMQAGQTRAAPTVRALQTVVAAARATPTLTTEQACLAYNPVCHLDGHFLLTRPIGPDGQQSIERSYPYGGTQDGVREPHHGVEFANPQGTHVLAVAGGKVVFAGTDEKIMLAWYTGFYGNVVVVEHHFPGYAEKVYTLYAHLSKIQVEVGQQVSAGELLGQVGSTGAAIGSHLHFEVRLQNNTYTSNRNPELWLIPASGTGSLAGRIEDMQSHPLAGTVNVQRMLNGKLVPLSVAALQPYSTKEAQPVHSDTAWQEEFAISDMPAGDYRLTLVYNDTIYEQMVKIEAGRLTYVRFVIRK